jgi:glyoxylase-like metal-dependent hydrolase (beta-lactamase superfamily II)
MNTYVLIDEETNSSAVIDPGGDPDQILAMVHGTEVGKIILTHGHYDHVMALEEIKTATGAEVYLHPADAEAFDLDYDHALRDQDEISIGNRVVRILHVPGHTPGQCCIDLGDGRILVGDTIFVGGPGRTATPEDFKTTMKNMRDIVFNWPEATTFFPGHGPSGTIGKEKPSFETFLNQGWSDDTHGDIIWE